MTAIRVFLVDDQALVRGGFRMLIDSQPDLVVVGEAGDGPSAVAALEHEPADVVLMDVRMPGMTGIEATRRILDRVRPAPRIVVLTTFDLDEYALEAIRAGASGFLLKDAQPEQLLGAIRTVHRGDAVIAPQTTRRLLAHLAPLLDGPAGPEPREANPALAERLERLTTREREVLELIAQGMSNQEIARELYLSEATVKTHVAHVLAKTDSRDRVQAVVFAYESGLVSPTGR